MAKKSTGRPGPTRRYYVRDDEARWARENNVDLGTPEGLQALELYRQYRDEAKAQKRRTLLAERARATEHNNAALRRVADADQSTEHLLAQVGGGNYRNSKFGRRLYRQWIKEQPKSHKTIEGKTYYTIPALRNSGAYTEDSRFSSPGEARAALAQAKAQVYQIPVPYAGDAIAESKRTVETTAQSAAVAIESSNAESLANGLAKPFSPPPKDDAPTEE